MRSNSIFVLSALVVLAASGIAAGPQGGGGGQRRRRGSSSAPEAREHGHLRRKTHPREIHLRRGSGRRLAGVAMDAGRRAPRPASL